MRWDEQSLALVASPTLLTATNARDGLPTIEEWRGLGVLFLLKLDDQLEIGPVAVDGELRTERACHEEIVTGPEVAITGSAELLERARRVTQPLAAPSLRAVNHAPTTFQPIARSALTLSYTVQGTSGVAAR